MKKSWVIGAILILIIAVIWFIVRPGGDDSSSLTKTDRQVLEVQDSRLTKGSEKAPVKIVEYADLLCPYCAKANEEVIPSIESEYIDKGDAHYEIRLVAMISPDSHRAAEGAYCAAEQNKFWDYMDTAYKDTWENYYSQNKKPQDVELFSEKNIYSFANRLGLDTSQWQDCMDEGKYQQTITDNQKKMNEIKAYGTPHFIINGNDYSGAPPFSAFKAVIDAELNKAKANAQ